MNKKLLVLTTVLTVGMLVGCGKKSTKTSSSEVVSVESTVSEAASVATSEATSVAAATTVATETSVSEAVDAALALADKAFSSATYTVTGYVVGDVSYNSKYSSYTFNIGDAKDSTKLLKVYSATLASGLNAPVTGSKVTAKGYLENYGSTAEMAGSSSGGVAFPEITACDATASSGASSSTTSATSAASSSSLSIAVASNEVLMSYSGSSTNFVDGNNAATLGLDANVFTVTSNTYTNSYGTLYAGLNKAGQIRIYAGQSVYIEATSAIDYIKIVYASTSAVTATVLVDNAEVTATDEKYTVNANKVEIKNAASSGQSHIAGVVIALK